MIRDTIMLRFQWDILGMGFCVETEAMKWFGLPVKTNQMGVPPRKTFRSNTLFEGTLDTP